MRLLNVANSVIGLPRWAKRIIVVLTDASLCVFSVWIAYFLRLSEWVPLYGAPGIATVGSLLIALPIFGIMGIYRPVFRYSEGTMPNHMLLAAIVYALLYAAVFTAWSFPGVPRTVGVLQPVLLFVFMTIARTGARILLHHSLEHGSEANLLPRILIYGAGVSGRQFAAAIKNRREMIVAGFIDDNREIQGASIDGVRVYAARNLERLVQRLVVDEILLAIPSATQHRRNEILAQLRPLRVNVRTLPDLMELALDETKAVHAKDLAIKDLLGRDPVLPDRPVMDRHIKGRVILVTGAGGSIGSELCRQLIASHPSTLLLFDSNEYALYTIHRELELLQENQVPGSMPLTKIVALLGSVQDERRIADILDLWKPERVYHAAAYKHVPLVEHNLIQGVENNVFGTINVARQCVQHGVPHFVLISTDKAVRPTNVMGATKRLAEMALQVLAQSQTRTCLSMVRFGNVLGSSGSVVPLFRQQIMKGGPITITDERITRFFMTIPEAAQLVIQAGAMASGGDVFVLDMGEPVRIIDLARNMVELSGLTIRDADNPYGDIELQVVGLRPGEKLYEELLIEDAPLQTSHPRIRKALEGFLPASMLDQRLAELKEAISARDPGPVRIILSNTVPEFQPNSDVVDPFYRISESSHFRGIASLS